MRTRSPQYGRYVSCAPGPRGKLFAYTCKSTSGGSRRCIVGERGDVPRLLAAGDVIVSSSAYGEGFSNAIAEGMAAGLVPVATGVGDVREIIGDTGEIVAISAPDALRRAIEKVLALPPGERRARGLAARDRIERLFSLDRAVDRFAALYSGPSAA